LISLKIDTVGKLMSEQLDKILSPYSGQREALISVLQKVQEAFGYLSAEAISKVAHVLCLSESEVYGVASFYALFRFERQGEHTIKVCQGTACHVRGAQRILEAVERELGIHCGETTKDFKFSLERVACFGACALAPVMVIDKTVNGKMTSSRAKKILDNFRSV
jgi:NADH:ubiquinone oxidoreductase subunit E